MWDPYIILSILSAIDELGQLPRDGEVHRRRREVHLGRATAPCWGKAMSRLEVCPCRTKEISQRRGGLGVNGRQCTG
jgi:hypothetical protein